MFLSLFCGHTFLFCKEKKRKLSVNFFLLQDQVSNNSAMCKASSSPPQIFVLLQYQTLAHRIKATVLRADNLDMLDGTSAPAGNSVSVLNITSTVGKIKRCLINELPEAHHARRLYVTITNSASGAEITQFPMFAFNVYRIKQCLTGPECSRRSSLFNDIVV